MEGSGEGDCASVLEDCSSPDCAIDAGVKIPVLTRVAIARRVFFILVDCGTSRSESI